MSESKIPNCQSLGTPSFCSTREAWCCEGNQCRRCLDLATIRAAIDGNPSGLLWAGLRLAQEHQESRSRSWQFDSLDSGMFPRRSRCRRPPPQFQGLAERSAAGRRAKAELSAKHGFRPRPNSATDAARRQVPRRAFCKVCSLRCDVEVP